MGFILSKFRAKKETPKERLEEIEKEVREIARFQIDTELKQKRIIGRILVYSAILYVIFCFGLYIWAPRGRPWTEQILYLLPLIVFPALMYLVRRATTYYFQCKIEDNREKFGQLRKEKERILEDVMEKETFKVAKEILEKYAPKELLPKYLAEQERNSSLTSPLPGLNTPGSFQDGLRRRQQSYGGAGTSTPLRGAYGRQSFTQSPITRPGGPGQYLRQPTNAYQYARPQLSIMGAPTPANRGPGSSQMPTYMMPLPPANPTMHNRGSGWMDKLVDYMVGDGVANRYALICRYCATHNGLATPEDYPYTGFRCVFCRQFNPPKEVRPTAPKLPVNQVLIEEMEQSSSTAKSDASTVSDEGSASGSRRGSGDLGSKPKVDDVESETEGDREPVITIFDTPPRASEGGEEDADNAESHATSAPDDIPTEFSPASIISLTETEASSRGSREEADEIENTQSDNNLSDRAATEIGTDQSPECQASTSNDRKSNNS